ncbi:glycosyltransferase [Microbacterium sp. G2-8]|uniref:glycosyltransferase n=1 Tax=Microbacterium sp. G2-8 TaxID=2842454 RepID=UPI001C8961F7|nr:glycosyltransferase [Microbacterium sp. G2-8]
MYEVLNRTTDEGATFDVSIVLPVFNAEGEALAERLAALVDGAGTNIELIVVDDASRDDTRAQLLAQLDGVPNTTVLGAIENGGVAAARNVAVTHAAGEYLWFVDWDDEWFPHTLSRLLEVAREEDADVVVCQADAIEAGRVRRIDGLEEAVTLGGAEAFDLLLQGRIAGYLWSKLIRRELLRADPFPLLSYQSDLGGFAPALARASRVVNLPEVLYHHLIRDGSISHSSTTDVTCKLECRDILTRTVDGLPPSQRRERLLRRFVFRRVYLGAVNMAVRLAKVPSDAADVITVIREEYSWEELRRHSRIDASTASRLALVKAMGPRFASLSGLARRLLRRTSTSQKPEPQRQPERVRVLHVAPPSDETTSFVDLITVGAATDGVVHRTFAWGPALRLDFDVLHIHWPERMIRGRTVLHRIGKRWATRLLLLRMSRGKLPIVRTLHNIAPHESGPRGEDLLLRRVDEATTTFVALNRRTPVPDSRAATSMVIPHPHYRGFHPTDPNEKPIAGRLLYFGLIRDYKGIDALIDAFGDLNSNDVSLRILGAPTPRWRDVIERASTSDPRISAHLEYVSDVVLAEEIRQAQAVVFPYRTMHNSGATFAALSQGRAVLVPSNDVNADLAAEVGESWVVTFDGEVVADDLRTLLSNGGVSQGHEAPSLNARDPHTVSRSYVDAYREALARVS